MPSLRTATAVIALLASPLVAAASASAETVTITILGVGDVYDFAGPAGRGGFARLNAVAKAERARNPNFIYVMDGDMLSPSLLSGLDKGANTIELTNLVPFDLAVPGNHEFDFGSQNFLERARASKYPWGAVNVSHADGKPIDGLVGTVFKTVAGVKVALVPVAQDTTPVVSSPGDWKFGNTVDSAVAAAKAARQQGADLVVGVVQADFSDDRAIIASHAFDVVVSGDDHIYGTSYDDITAYVETSTEAKYLSPIDLAVDIQVRDGERTVTWKPSFRYIDTAMVTPDPETQTLVDGFKTKLDQSLGMPVGATIGPLDSRRNIVRSEESAMGNLIADAMRAAAKADVAITNGGGIRADRVYAAGTVLTRKDILSELPFGNVTVLTEVKGAALCTALENGFSQVEDGAGRFPQVSGMRVEVDLRLPVGKRVLLVTIGDKPLDPAATYKVATNDFMLGGGDGYTALAGGNVLIDARGGDIMANDVIDFVLRAGRIDAKVEGRIVKK